MENKLKLLCAFTVLILAFLFGVQFTANSATKIVSNVEIVDVAGLKLIKDSTNLNYKLVEIPEGINIIDAKIIHLGNVYKFSDGENILLDKDGNFVQELTDDKYTLILNTKELGMIYKIINKVDYGYKVLDIKVVYDKYKNTLDIINSNSLLADSEVTLFKDTKVGSTKLNSEGKGSIYINDIENLTTATYTIIIKKGSEILGVDAFHITPIYKELKLEGNVNYNITSEISNKLYVTIKPESGITNSDKVEVVSVYDEEKSSENLLLNLGSEKNKIIDLNGEIILKNKLNNGNKYRVKLKINGIELEAQNDCNINIKNMDTSKIKITAIEKIGKDLVVDLSGVENLNKEDLIEIVSLYDVNEKDNNLISPVKLTNKVNEIKLLNSLVSSKSYEVTLKINNFIMDKFGVKVVPVDLSNATALTDIISKKVFISLENANGLKITDYIKVDGVFKEGEEDKNLLKSEYNTKINNLNGTIFINQTLDTKNNYYVKFKINNIDFDQKLKITVNNDISVSGAVAESKNLSKEIKLSFINVDSIEKSDLIEISSVFNLKDPDFNLLDKEKDNKITDKLGIIYLKTPILSENQYGLKIKINGVQFRRVIPVTFEKTQNQKDNIIEEMDKIKDDLEDKIYDENNVGNDFKNKEIEEEIKYFDENNKKNTIVEGYVLENNKMVLNLKELKFLSTDKVNVNSIKLAKNNEELLNEKIKNLCLNENNELIVPLNFTLEDNTQYILGITCLRGDVFIDYTLEYNNTLNKEESVKDTKTISENKKEISIDSIEFGDCYLKFEHNLEENMKFDRSYCDISAIESRIEGKYIVVDKLIPYKKYKDLIIKVKNSRGAMVEFNIPEFICGESEDIIKNFISKTYVSLKNGLDLDKDDLEFADEVEFWFWHNKIKKKEVDLRKFILQVINESDFINKYPDNSEKIKIMYRIIYNINPSEQSLNVWLNDFNKALKNDEIESALKSVVEKMFTNLNFKSIEKQLK